MNHGDTALIKYTRNFYSKLAYMRMFQVTRQFFVTVVYPEAYLLKSLYFLPRQARTDFYFGVILPSVTYGMLVWGLCSQVLFSDLESIHVRAAKIIFNLDWCTPSKEVLAIAKWNTLATKYEKRLLILVHQAHYHLLPCPMSCLFVKCESRYDLGGK